MTAWTGRRYAVIDVEGNGCHPPDLVELGVVPIVDGAIGTATTWLFKPDEPITPMARRIHGITNDMVAGAPVFAELADEIEAHLDRAVLVAHNAAIDLGVLRRKLPAFDPGEVLDTLKLSRRLLRNQPSHRLSSLARALRLDEGLPPGLKPHRVSYDVLVTARLLTHLATGPDGKPRSFEDLRSDSGGEDHGLF